MGYGGGRAAGAEAGGLIGNFLGEFESDFLDQRECGCQPAHLRANGAVAGRVQQVQNAVMGCSDTTLQELLRQVLQA